jgi:hypothetical protein
VVSLRNFIRTVLDLDAIPADVLIPKQGPARPGAVKGGEGKGAGERNSAGGGRGGGDMAAGAGAGMGLGLGGGMAAANSGAEDNQDPIR